MNPSPSRIRILNSTRKTLIADRAVLADTFMSRMVGLLNREKFEEGEGLIITQCQSIHMVGMRFPIDVIFIDPADKVVGLVEHIKPCGFSPLFFKANRAIEVPTQTIVKSQTHLGDHVQILTV